MASGGPPSDKPTLMNEIATIFSSASGSKIMFDLLMQTPSVLQGLLKACHDSKQEELDEVAKGIAVSF